LRGGRGQLGGKLHLSSRFSARGNADQRENEAPRKREGKASFGVEYGGEKQKKASPPPPKPKNQNPPPRRKGEAILGGIPSAFINGHVG